MQLTEKQKYEIIVLRENGYKINEIANKMRINRKAALYMSKSNGGILNFAYKISQSNKNLCIKK